MMTKGVMGTAVGQGVRAGLAMLALLAGGAAAAAQEPAVAPQGPNFRGGVDLVTIRAVVRDGRGRPVTTLGKADFELLDNGATREILAVEQDNGPVGLAMLFDISGQHVSD